MLIERSALVLHQKLVNFKHPEESQLLLRVQAADNPMPPIGKGTRLTTSEVALLSRWILVGAPDWKRVPITLRPLIPIEQLLAEAASDLKSMSQLDRPFLRYFTTAHLSNAQATQEEMDAFQTALSKLLNSLSWEKAITRPVPVGAGGVLFRIDLRHYNWTVKTWDSIITNYPYALNYRQPSYHALTSELKTQVPILRADWFIAQAAIPPLYETILGFTDRTNALRQLESDRLHIQVTNNLATAPGVRVWRSGFVESGVSQNNRIVERHISPFGAYWKSYDFKGNTGFRNILRYPKSFRHDGGELIFNLPNGLQAYLLVNQHGHLLEKAPIEIVRDPAGLFPEVVNGISCMSCHSEGMKPLDDKADQVRQSLLARHHAEDTFLELLALYVDAAIINQLIEEDRRRFVSAVEQTGAAAGSREPILRLVQRYADSLDLHRVAAELHVTPELLQDMIQHDEVLHASSLRVLTLPKGTLKRDLFEKLFSPLAARLELGINPQEEATWQTLLLKANLGDLNAYFALGLLYATGRGVRADFDNALAFWKTAADKDHLPSCLLASRILSTADIERLRNSQAAIELAVRAAKLTEYREPKALDCLAAAYAAAGNFAEAVRWQQEALNRIGPGTSQEAYAHRLLLYQERKPLRQPWEILFTQ